MGIPNSFSISSSEICPRFLRPVQQDPHAAGQVLAAEKRQFLTAQMQRGRFRRTDQVDLLGFVQNLDRYFSIIPDRSTKMDE